MNSMPFRQLKSFLQILIGVQYDTTNEGGTVSLVLSMEKPLLSFGESRGFCHYVDSRSRMHGEVQ